MLWFLLLNLPNSTRTALPAVTSWVRGQLCFMGYLCDCACVCESGRLAFVVVKRNLYSDISRALCWEEWHWILVFWWVCDSICVMVDKCLLLTDYHSSLTKQAFVEEGCTIHIVVHKLDYAQAENWCVCVGGGRSWGLWYGFRNKNVLSRIYQMLIGIRWDMEKIILNGTKYLTRNIIIECTVFSITSEPCLYQNAGQSVDLPSLGLWNMDKHGRTQFSYKSA